MEREHILITVRTYPAISARYTEVVCTGGITSHLQWRRLLVPLRYLDDEQQYRTFNQIEVDVGPGKDGRPETRVAHLPTLKIVGAITDWGARCKWVNPTICPSLDEMKSEGRTLAPVAVQEVVDFVAKPGKPDWTSAQKEKMKQQRLFDEGRPLEKIPFDFRFVWRDQGGVQHKSLFMAWEVGETYRQYKRAYDNPIQVMRDKWLTDICGPKRRVTFFMGNLAKRRSVFAVCGIFAPPKEVADSESLF